MFDERRISEILADRPPDGHKGTFGRALIVGGSVGMSGSVCLASTAALRGGAGLVSAAVPVSIQSIVASYEPSFMTIGLPCTADGQLDYVTKEMIHAILHDKDCVAVGPGLGRSSNAAEMLNSIVRESNCEVVLDADALNLASEHGLYSQLTDRPPCVVTPHPGEFSRMTGRSITDISRDRENLARDFARSFGVVVVLKGRNSVVTDGVETYINQTGNSGMATGGSGDVLTGILAAQIAQGIPCFDAACLAVYVHGLAGDLAAAQTSERGLIASDLLRFLGPAWLRLQESVRA